MQLAQAKYFKKRFHPDLTMFPYLSHLLRATKRFRLSFLISLPHPRWSRLQKVGLLRLKYFSSIALLLIYSIPMLTNFFATFLNCDLYPNNWVQLPDGAARYFPQLLCRSVFWIHISRVAPNWDLWRTLYGLSYHAAAVLTNLGPFIFNGFLSALRFRVHFNKQRLRFYEK